MSETLASIVGEFREAIAPFRVASASSAEMQALFARYGWDVEIAANQLNAVTVAFALEPLIEELLKQSEVLIYGTDSERLAAIADTLMAVQNIGARFSSFQGASAPLPPFDDPAIWTELASRMIGDLVVTYIERRQPIAFALAHAFGVVRFDRVVPAGDFRMPYVCGSLDFEQLGRLFTAPAKAVRDLYGWGTATFDHHKLLTTFERILLALGLNAEMGPPRRDLAQGRIDLTLAAEQGVRQLDGYLIHGVDSVGMERWRIGVRALPVPAQPGTGAPVGLVLTPLIEGAFSAAIALGSTIKMEVCGATEKDNALVVRLMPDGITAQVDAGVTEIAMQVALVGQPVDPYLLIGARNETRLELDGFRFEAGVDGTLAAPEIYFRVDLGAREPKLRLVVDLSDTGDGFIGSVIGKQLTAAFGLDLLWSSRSGVRIGGNEKFNFRLPFVIEMGPLMIGPLTVVASGDVAGAALALGLDVSLTLGPLLATVQNIGAKLVLTPAEDGRGTFGPLDISVAFKPPDGIGLGVNSSVVKGGGFLSLDYPRQQYAGVLQLSIQDTIDIKAIGILNTRLPNNRPGFSLLLIITGEFPPIQLGLGFTLNGVGGLLGVNRSAGVEVLRSGLRNGVLDSILFPPDPLRNVPALLNTLSSAFPVAEGRFVFGPMVKISWGSPSILNFDIALLLEMPDPVRVILLGRVKATLPDEKNPVAILRMDVLGVLDFQRHEMSIDGTLYDSRLLTFTLSGDMALRLNWGPQPSFLLSIGGFHPHFSPPSAMPKLERMTIVVVDREEGSMTARLRFESYIALTSNTVQFGARAHACFKALGFEAVGILGFDALFHFAPFTLEAELACAVTLSFEGVVLMGADLALTLTGPRPWHVVGEAQFTFLGAKVRAQIDVKTGVAGDEQPALPPAVDVSNLLAQAFADSRNWQSIMPLDADRIVRIRIATGDAGTAAPALVLHPLACLAARQRVAPLGVTLSRFGNAPVQGARCFDLEFALPGSAVTALHEDFAMGQFQTLRDDEKLARPSFEPAQAGLRIGDDRFAFSTSLATASSVEYELRILQPEGAAPPAPASSPASAMLRSTGQARYAMPAEQAQALLGFGATGRAASRRTGKSRYAPPQASPAKEPA